MPASATRLRVKICCIKSLAEARLALTQGAATVLLTAAQALK